MTARPIDDGGKARRDGMVSLVERTKMAGGDGLRRVKEMMLC